MVSYLISSGFGVEFSVQQSYVQNYQVAPWSDDSFIHSWSINWAPGVPIHLESEPATCLLLTYQLKPHL